MSIYICIYIYIYTYYIYTIPISGCLCYVSYNPEQVDGCWWLSPQSPLNLINKSMTDPFQDGETPWWNSPISYELLSMLFDTSILIMFIPKFWWFHQMKSPENDILLLGRSQSSAPQERSRAGSRGSLPPASGPRTAGATWCNFQARGQTYKNGEHGI